MDVFFSVIATTIPFKVVLMNCTAPTIPLVVAEGLMSEMQHLVVNIVISALISSMT